MCGACGTHCWAGHEGIVPTPTHTCLALAGRISRAWRRFLQSPGRRRQVEAATHIQAAWRGRQGRRQAAARRTHWHEHQAGMAALRSAVQANDLALATQAAQRLELLGCGSEAAPLLASLQQQATSSEQALKAGAASGSAVTFSAAAAAAGRFAHLSAALQAASAVFAARLAQAEEAVTNAASCECLQQDAHKCIPKIPCLAHYSTSLSESNGLQAGRWRS